VDESLVLFEQSILLLGKLIWLEGDFELVRRPYWRLRLAIGRSLYVCIFRFVYDVSQDKIVATKFLLPDAPQPVVSDCSRCAI
jgi:hypothetical protein